MYIAMNRFRVAPENEAAFTARWLGRDVHLKTVPGFLRFHLLRGPVAEDHILYASHTLWRSYEDFLAWTKSDAFRAAHANAGEGRALTMGPPVFEGFSVLQEVVGPEGETLPAFAG